MSERGKDEMARTKSKDERIRGEKQRLKKLYSGMTPARLKLAMGLIERASFLRVELEDLELDLLENGWTEPFQQSRGMDPYDRARPQGQTYQTAVKNYRDTIKQLDSMLPQKVPATTEEDGFDSFVTGRDEL